MTARVLIGSGLLGLLAACGDKPALPDTQGFGPTPVLPAPSQHILPTVHIAQAVGWTDGQTPVPAEGLVVQAFAQGLSHPRWLLALPNGDVLVAETDAPPKPDDAKGLRGWIMKRVMKQAGSGRGSPDRLVLLRDADGDGQAEFHSVLLSGLHSPFGMARVGSWLYVADTDALLRFPYRDGDTRITARPEKVTDLPAGSLNHHWTKNVIARADGEKLYVSVGSNSNAAENGIEVEDGRAAIWEIDAATGQHRLYATGLRNPNGMAWAPGSGTLWTVVNERDELGNDLVPDYLTSVRPGAFYGWPYSYWGGHVDERVQPQRPDLVARAVVPDYALGSHTASLGLVFAEDSRLPAPFAHGAFIGQHGSWNRKPRSGYRVIFVPFEAGRPAGPPQEVLGGFVNARGEAQGRPVGLAWDRQGALLVADDVGNTVWRVRAASAP